MFHLSHRITRVGGVATLACAVTLTASAPGGLWLAPDPPTVTSRSALSRAVADLAADRAAEALPVFLAAASDAELGGYALLYAGRAQIKLGRFVDARKTAQRVLAMSASDALAESASWLAVEAAAEGGDKDGVVDVLKELADRPNSAPASILLRLFRAALDADNKAEAVAAFNRLYFDFAGTAESIAATNDGRKAGIVGPPPSKATFAVSMQRAERLFTARQFTDARVDFEALKLLASPVDRPLIELRLAEIEFSLKKYPVAAVALKAAMERPSPFTAEARYYYLGTLRESGRADDYEEGVRDFAKSRTDSVFIERALNELGTYYILQDEDEKAADLFADYYKRYPQGVFADRAAWRAGWWAYKHGEFDDAIRIFETAAVGLRRADYRPSWLYWAARAHLENGNGDAAVAGYRRVIADYRNSYYGRAAVRELEQIHAARRPAGAGPVSPARRTWTEAIVPAAPPANAPLIEHLLAARMYDEAAAELKRLQATGQGSPVVDATLAYALNRQGKLRPAITAMRRAYPQFMAEGGEALPREILTVIFPIDYWELIQSHAVAKKLDPFLVAALVAQESTFQADVRSSADAWGLMQIIPGTGRRYARSIGIKPFSTSRLTEPETNVRIGTTYFSDLLRQFGDTAPALAAYNAGESRVAKWLAERPGLDRDEFIDDIPFPETQNYVKRILGTAEDYRILYGSGKR
jgi:soluble lytic murein transglycosylase